MSLPTEPKFAKLRPERAKFYPAVNRETWFPVVKVDDLGVRVALRNRELFVFWADVEVRL